MLGFVKIKILSENVDAKISVKLKHVNLQNHKIIRTNS